MPEKVQIRGYLAILLAPILKLGLPLMKKLLKGTVMQTEKALINNRLSESKVF